MSGLLLAVTATTTGVLSGMAVGGGSVLVPALVLLFHVSQHRAQGAVLPALLAMSAVSAWVHWRAGHVDRRLAWRLVPFSVPAALAGAWLAARADPGALRQAYGLFLLAAGVVTLLEPAPAHVRRRGR